MPTTARGALNSLARSLWRRQRECAAQLRTLTGKLRPLPDYVIIGTMKGGTTSLYSYLTQHPWIAPASDREIHFFDVNYDRGLDWYRAHFPLLRGRRQGGESGAARRIAGESSPYYLFHPLAPARMRSVVPDAKLIAVLRHPVDRAYSHYQHERAKGRETLSFEDAISAEADRLRGERERMMRDPSYRSHSHQHHSYLSRGVYVDQLESWAEHFPREQLLVVKSEDLFAQPSAVLARVLSFLGVPEWHPKAYRVYNSRSYEAMPDGLRAQLVEYFRPHNARLYRYLGADLGWDSPCQPGK